MTCQEALKLLYEVIDKEASQIDTERVRKHLEECQHCFKRFEFEAMFKTFVSEKAASVRKAEQLKARIMARIEETEKAPRRFFFNPFRYKTLAFASAATLVVFVVAALSVAQFIRHQEYIYPFEKDHIRADFSGNASPDDAAQAQIAGYLSGNLHLAVSREVPGYQLVHSGYDEILGHKYAHLQYLKGESHVSLYIGSAEGVNLPDFKRLAASGTEYFRHVCSQCQVIYWKRGNSIMIAVSGDKGLELPSLIPAVTPL